MREYKKAAFLAWATVGGMVKTSSLPEEYFSPARFYLLHLSLGISLPLLAELGGCSKQNVSKTIKTFDRTLERDPVLAENIEKLEETLLGICE